MNARKLRDQSRIQVEALGYSFNPHLPVLDGVEVTRSSDELLNRILILHACIACSFGYPKQQALNWLNQEGLTEYLSGLEFKFLHDRTEGTQTAFQWQVEAVWALTWAAGYHSKLDFSQPCSDGLVRMLPDLNTNASSRAFRQECALRTCDEIAKMVDLSYCLHWAVREEGLGGSGQKRNDKVQGRVVEERRRALEWLVCDEDWEDVPLDT
jgi:hypothetical protein